MIKIDEQIRAFPQLHSIDGNWNKGPDPEYRGMTLRDYFAAKALTALIRGYDGALYKSDTNIFTEEAYRFADSMLQERNKTNL